MKLSRIAASFSAAAGVAIAAEGGPEARVYHLQTMGRLQITVPVGKGVKRILYRDASGKWRAVREPVKDGLLTLELVPEQLEAGKTMLVVGVPESVNLEDSGPPEVSRIEVDGAEHGPTTALSLGGLASPPRELLLEVRDADNDIRADSLRVSVNGREHRLPTPGMRYETISSRHGIVHVSLADLAETVQSSNTVSVSVDDCALDDARLTFALSFNAAPSHRLADGTRLSVDSVVANAGWAEWWVVSDGVKMDSNHSTTAGYTWLSDGNDAPHWIMVEFPEPKEVRGVALWWAYWKGFRSSAAYKVQTRSGDKWVTQVEIKDQDTTRTSRHTFPPATTRAVRIWQPAMQGHPAEPQYMWISELEVLH